MRILLTNLLKYLTFGGTLFLGLILFEGQDVSLENNPNIDRMPHNVGINGIIPPQPNATVMTVNGYDNWWLGNDDMEPYMSVNTRNPSNFLPVFTFVSARYTLDGWNWLSTNTGVPAVISDPWTASDSLGNLYFMNLSLPNGTLVTRSSNGGATWSPPVSGVNGIDKEVIVADETAGPYTNYLYSSITATAAGNCSFARSIDMGISWVQTFTTTLHNLPGAMICVGPNGNVQGGCVYLVTFSGSNSAATYYFFRSTDGGLTFTQMGSVSGIGVIGTEVGGRSTINGARTRPYPWIAADNSFGPYRGRLYLVNAMNNPPGGGNKPDIYLRYSTNQGATFSSPVVVNDNANPTLTNQWMPAIWCEKTTGRLYIKWYDMRNDPANQLVDVYATFTTDGGQTFRPNQRVTNASWNYPSGSCSAPCYKGDYDAIAANPLTSLSAWYDGRTGQGSFVGYFPDFAMTALPADVTLNNFNDTGYVRIAVPGIKLYTDKAKFTAAINPAPGGGTISMTFLNRTSNVVQDSLTSYPDSLRLRIVTSGGVTAQTYTITVTGKGSNGTPIHKRNINLSVVVGIVNYSNEIPQDFYLYQNYPNPFNPVTLIRFDIPKSGNVRLSVYDIAGRFVSEVVNGFYKAGKYTADFNAEKLSSGVYFYKLQTERSNFVRKMILIR